MIENEYGGEDGKSAFVTGYGVTDDKDLYADFIMTEYEDHVPIRYKKARLHFQCDQKTDRISDCSHALWAEKEWTETSEEYRAEYRSYNDAVEALVDRYNSTEDESEREKIIEEEKELDKKFDKSFFEYWK